MVTFVIKLVGYRHRTIRACQRDRYKAVLGHYLPSLFLVWAIARLNYQQKGLMQVKSSQHKKGCLSFSPALIVGVDVASKEPLLPRFSGFSITLRCSGRIGQQYWRIETFRLFLPAFGPRICGESRPCYESRPIAFYCAMSCSSF